MSDYYDKNDSLKVDTVDDMSDVGDAGEALEVSSNATERSGSDYVGVGTEGLPDYVWFGGKECRCIFSLGSDKGEFQRVCGNAFIGCNRPGHSINPKADIGYYRPAKARKFIDGKLETLISKEEYEGLEKARKERNREALLAAGEYLGRASMDAEEADKTVTFRDNVKGASALQGNSLDGKFENAEASWNLVGAKDESSVGTSNWKLGEEVGEKTAAGSDTLVDVMKMLSISMANLNQQVARMDANQQRSNEMLIKAIDEQKKRSVVAASTNSTKPVATLPSTTLKQASTSKEEKMIFYALARGKGGAQGIFTNLGEVSPLVLGVSNATYTRCDTREEAEEFIKAFNNAGGQVQVRGKKKWYVVVNTATGYCGLFNNWPEAAKHTVGVSCATSYGFTTEEEALHYYEACLSSSESSEGTAEMSVASEEIQRLRGGSANLKVKETKLKGGDGLEGYPPSKLMGPDESIGREEEIFGVDLSVGESELKKVFTPTFLTNDQKKGLLNNATDVVALPGMFNGIEELDQNDSSELTMLGEAMEELVNQKRHGGEQTGRADLHWRTDRRISLINVKSLGDLFKRVTILQKLELKVRKRMVTAMSNACKGAGVTDMSMNHAWSNYGWLTTIIMRSLTYYIGLHQHLLCNGQTNGWDYIKIERDHFLEELRLVRHTADSRIHCICLQYTLLRDGYKNNWFNSTIQQSRNLMTFGSPSVALKSPTELSSMSGGLCPKCLTNIHGPNVDFCPWKNQSDENAVKNAAQALRNMGKTGNKKE